MSDELPTPKGHFLIYHDQNGQPLAQLRQRDGSVWFTQSQLAELYQVSKQTISLHIKTILSEGELSYEATVKEYLTVGTEMRREVERQIMHYSLEMILAIGYRVRSLRGTQFRQWATRHLAEYLVKGFVMDDERLKDPQGWDYFDELLERDSCGFLRRVLSSDSGFKRLARKEVA